MFKPSHPTIYDSIGAGYQSNRIPDRRIEAAIRAAIGDCKTICNVGAGTGSYEPSDLDVVAVEPSARMIEQRINSNAVVEANAKDLPFCEKQFDASMAILTIHHWKNVRRGLEELARVSVRQIIFTYDPGRILDFWLLRDYFPDVIEHERARSVPLRVIEENLNVHSIQPVPIPWDCTDGFLAAYWRRPECYLNPCVRDSISTFAQMPAEWVTEGVNCLARDLESGEWHRKNQSLLNLSEMDLGYRIIVAGATEIREV